MKRYLTAAQAAEILGVSRMTLYSYVSRGLIRSEEGDRSHRERRYFAEDVQKLKERKKYRRDPAQVAQDALYWGTPVLDSALTLITDSGLYYRGKNVLKLAASPKSSFEQVAALLWTGDVKQITDIFEGRADTTAILREIDLNLTPMQRVSIALALADDVAAFDLKADAVARSGARILTLVASALTMEAVRGSSLAGHLQRAWQPGDAKAARLIEAALILCADHELNASSFAARVAASAGANPYAVVAAGLAALSGFRHGGASLQVEAFFREIGDERRIERATAERMRRGERIPGFGHSLYPEGDPRATTLLALLEEAYPDSSEMIFALLMADHVSKITGQQPNVDFALVALARVVGLPEDAPLSLFALGRTAGWIGHAIEQYGSGTLIRPRARYTGDKPEGSNTALW